MTTKLKTPYDFEADVGDYVSKADKCFNIVDKFVYWFDELLKVKLDEIVEDNTALRNRELSFTNKDIPNNLQALVAYTWLKFDYFCHTKRKGKHSSRLEDLELESNIVANLEHEADMVKDDTLKLEWISTNTFLRESEHHFAKNYFDELTNSIKQSNYLATSFAIAGWDLIIKDSHKDGVCYMLKWDKTKIDYTKMLPKITDKYTDRVITPVTDATVKAKLSFNQAEFAKWFNDELSYFYRNLHSADKLKYSVSKEVVVDYTDIPEKYYKFINSDYGRYIDFEKPFTDALQANGWTIKDESLGNTVTFVYVGN